MLPGALLDRGVRVSRSRSPPMLTWSKKTGARLDEGGERTMERASEPFVSVIIPCYNQGHFLAQAIDTALRQTYPHVQVIVGDDGSTDEDRAGARRYGDRIPYSWQENAGVAVARNVGLLETQSEFVLFLDADDYLWPDLLEKHLEVARANRNGTV